MPVLLQTAAAVAAAAGRTCVGLAFCTAAPPKLRHRLVFEGVVANYRILPNWLERPAARGLPAVELAVGLLLVAGLAPRLAGAAAAAMLLAFAWAMGLNLKRGRGHIDCGCHRSTLRQTLSWALVWRNAALALLAVAGAAGGGAGSLGERLVGMTAGLVLFLIYLLFNTLSALPAFGRAVL